MALLLIVSWSCPGVPIAWLSEIGQRVPRGVRYSCPRLKPSQTTVPGTADSPPARPYILTGGIQVLRSDLLLSSVLLLRGLPHSKSLATLTTLLLDPCPPHTLLRASTKQVLAL